LKYFSNKKGFLGIDNKGNRKDNVVIVPFGLEKTVSYGSGTSKGPAEIIKASHQVELFDEDLNKEPYKFIGIKTLKPFSIKKNIVDALKQIENINKFLIDKKKFPLTLGGEHLLKSLVSYACFILMLMQILETVITEINFLMRPLLEDV